MYKFYSIYLVFLCFLIACVSRGEYSQTELRELENDVIRHDDKGSYSLLRVYYGTDSISHKLLPYSLKMVKDSKTGCYDFYFNYLKLRFENKFDHKNILKLEKSEQDFLIFLIRKGALNGNNSCRKVLIKHYVDGIIVGKDLFKADSIYKTLGYPALYYKENSVNDFKVELSNFNAED